MPETTVEEDEALNRLRHLDQGVVVGAESMEQALGRARGVLDRSREALDAARRAAERTSCRFPLDSEQAETIETPHLYSVVSLTRLLAAEAVSLARAGRTAEAYESLRIVFACADSVAGEPMLMSLAFHGACLSYSLDALRAIAALIPPPAGTRAAWSAVLAALADRSAPAKTFASVRCFGIDVFEHAIVDPERRKAILGTRIEIPEGEPEDVKRRFAPDHLFFLSQMRRAIELLGEPAWKSREAFDALRKEAEETVKNRGFGISAMLLPALLQLRQDHSALLTRFELSRAALAVLDVKERTGVFPSALEGSPVDDWTGRVGRRSLTRREVN